MTQTAAELRIALGRMTRAQFAGLLGAIRDEHTERTGCKTMGQGRSNRERTNQRRVTTLSSFIRDVPGIRSIDIDQLAYCPDCWEPLAWMETKPSNKADEWQLVRHLARRDGCYAILGVEPDHPVDALENVVIYPADPRPRPC